MSPCPRGLRDLKPSSTTHDAMQLWLSSNDNAMKVVLEIAKKIVEEPDDESTEYSEFRLGHTPRYDQCSAGSNYRGITHYHGIKTVYKFQRQIKPQPQAYYTKELEKPIYDYNKFLLGIIDCYIDANAGFEYEITSWKATSTNPNAEEPEVDPNSERQETKFIEKAKFILLIKIKPKLNNVSSTVGQIKAYRESLHWFMHDYDPKNLKTIILTTDDHSNYRRPTNKV